MREYITEQRAALMPTWVGLFVFAPQSLDAAAEEVCADRIVPKVIRIYVRKWTWHDSGQVPPADIYLSLMIITMSPRATLEGSKENACQNSCSHTSSAS